MTHDKLATALVKAQSEMETPHLDAKANAGKFGYKYATLAEIRRATLPALQANGLAIMQIPDVLADGFGIRTVLLHESGGRFEGFYPILPNPDPQKIGSAITYAKRYSWASMCGVVAEDDDDAQYALQPAEKPAQQQSAPKAQAQASKPNGATASSEPPPSAIPHPVPDGTEEEWRRWISDMSQAASNCAAVAELSALDEANRDGMTALKAIWLDGHTAVRKRLQTRFAELSAVAGA